MTSSAAIHTFSVYANPKLGEVYIDLVDKSTHTSYEVLNAQKQVISANNDLIIRNTISLKALPVGMYTVKIKNRHEVMIKKFLKL